MFIIPFRIIQFGWHERLWKTALYKPCQHLVCFLRRNIFQDVLHRDTLVKAFLDQVFHLKPGLSLRSTFLAQFLLVLHRKALTLIKYIEDDTQKGKKPFKSLRNLKIDLDLTAEGDLNIIMALAEKIKPGLHSFIFGRPFYTSVQERDVLMTF